MGCMADYSEEDLRLMESVRGESKAEIASLRKKMEDLQTQFNKMWSCLKFEKMSSKVIGYTFDKKDMDKFKEDLQSKVNK